jgi:hypothetical protein
MNGEPADPRAGLLDALQRAGLELHEQGASEGAEYLVSGNTFANKDVLRRGGGRWSRRRQAWVFASMKPIRELAAALPADGGCGAGRPA